MTAIQPSDTDPWASAADVSDALGMSLAVFGLPGAGKTTLAAEPGALIVDLEGGAEVLADRSDVMIWPKKDPKTGKVPVVTWDMLDSLSTKLLNKPHPFKIICFDTMSKMQRLALKKVMKASATPEMPSQPEYGKANELVNTLIEDWCGHARENNLCVIFNCHAEEEQDGDVVLIRMSLSPGVRKVMYQAVSTIGYLSSNARTEERQLLLKSTNKITAKIRQPRSGKQIPLEIKNPSIAKILEHRAQVRQERNNG